MKELRVLKPYLGWASAEVPWTKGMVVEVDDTTPVEYRDEYTTVADYLLTVFPDRFELAGESGPAEEPESPEKPKRTRKPKEG